MYQVHRPLFILSDGEEKIGIFFLSIPLRFQSNEFWATLNSCKCSICLRAEQTGFEHLVGQATRRQQAVKIRTFKTHRPYLICAKFFIFKTKYNKENSTFLSFWEHLT